MPFNWTPDRIKQLQQLIGLGVTAPLIAETMGTTPSSVYHAREHYGIAWPDGPRVPGRPTGNRHIWTADRLEQLRELTFQGRGSDAVGEIMGMTPTAIRAARSTFGLTLRDDSWVEPKRPRTERSLRILELAKAGVKVPEIVEIVGGTVASVRTILTKAGIRTTKEVDPADLARIAEMSAAGLGPTAIAVELKLSVSQVSYIISALKKPRALTVGDIAEMRTQLRAMEELLRSAEVSA